MPEHSPEPSGQIPDNLDPHNPWFGKHSPEPWQRNSVDPAAIVDANGLDVLMRHDGCGWPNDADLRRIVACVNFCREFDTKFLQAHRLKRIPSDAEVYSDPRTWPQPGLKRVITDDITDFDSFVAVELLPVAAQTPPSHTPQDAS